MAGQSKTSAVLSNGPFVICVIILGATAIGLPAATRHMRIVLGKQPVPLRQPLSRLNKNALGPYQFVTANTLDPAVVDSLGTREYIDWILEDTTHKDRSSPLRYVRLHITYYTGQPDPVPHTPDVCMLGAGYQAEQAANTSIHVSALAGSAEVPVRVLTFVKSHIFDADKMPVVYTFHCNGHFAATRERVRNLANNPLDKHAYYSKVEVNFGWEGARPHFPTREEAIKATEKLLSYVLPLLLEEHWPDWDAVEAAEDGGAS